MQDLKRDGSSTSPCRLVRISVSTASSCRLLLRPQKSSNNRTKVPRGTVARGCSSRVREGAWSISCVLLQESCVTCVVGTAKHLLVWESERKRSVVGEKAVSTFRIRKLGKINHCDRRQSRRAYGHAVAKSPETSNIKTQTKPNRDHTPRLVTRPLPLAHHA